MQRVVYRVILASKMVVDVVIEPIRKGQKDLSHGMGGLAMALWR
jgi:hypothetical protein